MRLPFYSLLPAVLFIIYGPSAAAENPGREKCTCNIETDSPPSNGAWVQNATSCWSTDIATRQWCDITVQSLEGGANRNSIVLQLLSRSDDPAALTTVMTDLFTEFVRTAANPESPLDFNLAMQTVPGLLKANDQVIQECATAFGGGRRGFQMEGQDSLLCRVGEVSGWLRIEFQIGDVRLAYMLAPPSGG